MDGFNQYQFETRSTAIYRDKPGAKIIYPAFGLANEAGEVLGKLKKVIRDADGIDEITDEQRQAVADEIGDVLWYCATLADDLGYTLGRIAKMNLQKLESRQNRGVLGGSGDNR